MDKNTIIAFVLIGIILLLWPVFQSKIVGVPESKQQQNQGSAEQPYGESVSESATQPAVESRENIQENRLARKMDGDHLRRHRIPADTVVIENNLFRGKLSTQGGGTIVSWQLKKYLKPRKESSQEKEWVEMILSAPQSNLGISIPSLESRGINLNDVNFQYEIDTVSAEKMVRFYYNLKNGSRIEKEFRVTNNRYDIDMWMKLNLSDRNDLVQGYQIQWTSGLFPTEKREDEENPNDDLPYYEALALQGGELLKTKEKSTGIREGTTQWAAVRTKYFLMALMPQEIMGKAVELSGEKIEGSKWKDLKLDLYMPSSGRGEVINHFKIYLGPMDYIQLKQYDVQLEKLMNFGWAIIRPFGIFFFHTLQFLHKILGNYGWAIIVFSILIKVVLYPLTRKSFQSMRKMQELQPKMEALREKFKKDPQRLNQETMKLYKQHGVNPLGGCLPMLLQMPVLFALFNLFRTTIMLRQAKFLLIRDLSSPDAIIAPNLHLLPILMGASMIIQQKLSMQDPKQKMMAYFMPIFLTFIFFRLSAGLNLYYLMFNLLTIVQEVIIKRHK